MIAVPREWRVSMYKTDPDMVCLHVARQTFGDKATLVGLENQVYADAIGLLEKVCIEQGKSFELIDPVDMLAKIDDGYKYVRVVKNVSGK